MKLLEYLHEYDNFGPNIPGIGDHFRERFGVSVRSEEDLYLFKYDMISAKWDDDITHECRGVILRRTYYDGGHWDVASRPYDKFFNLSEGRCPVFEQEHLHAQLDECALVEKADGTCIQLWWDAWKEKWRASTLGTITTSNIPEENFTFADLFWKVSKLSSGIHLLNKNTTYLFELCCDENRIVTKYATNQVVMLSARVHTGSDKEYTPGHRARATAGAYAHQCDLMTLCTILRNDMGCNVRPSRRVYPRHLNIKTRADLVAYIEAESERDEQHDEKWPEGFVLYDAYNVPIAKLKNQRYLALHHTSDADVGHSKNKIIDAIFLGFIDDIYEVLSDRLRAFADATLNKYREFKASTYAASMALAKQGPYENRKAIAVAIQDKSIPTEIRPFLFHNISSLLEGSLPDFDESFDAWIKDNYSKIDWKDG